MVWDYKNHQVYPVQGLRSKVWDCENHQVYPAQAQNWIGKFVSIFAFERLHWTYVKFEKRHITMPSSTERVNFTNYKVISSLHNVSNIKK